MAPSARHHGSAMSDAWRTPWVIPAIPFRWMHTSPATSLSSCTASADTSPRDRDAFHLWDRRMTASGVTRREQRAKYDQLREIEIARHGLRLLVVSADDLAVDRRGRLRRRTEEDRGVLQRALRDLGIPLRLSV